MQNLREKMNGRGRLPNTGERIWWALAGDIEARKAGTMWTGEAGISDFTWTRCVALGGCTAETQGKVLAVRVWRGWGLLVLRRSKSPRIHGGAVSHVTTPLDWSRVGIVEKMAAQREPHRSRSVHTAPPSVQEGGEGPGERGPFLVSGQGRRRRGGRGGALMVCTNSGVLTGLDFQKQRVAPATNVFCVPFLNPVP